MQNEKRFVRVTLAGTPEAQNGNPGLYLIAARRPRRHEAMKTGWKLSTFTVALLVAVLLPASNAFAGVIPVGPFTGSSLITFTGLATGTEVNGLVVSGVLFTYTVGGSPLNGALQIDGGPGITNNVAPPNI